MSLDNGAFLIHDVAAFPVVWVRHDEIQPGSAAQWEVEMDDLIGRKQPFVMIMASHHHDEAHEDRKARGLWLKRNKATLALLCRAIIAVEPNAVTRVLVEAQSALATKAFGISSAVVASEDEAMRVARERLQIAR
ncbi:hypothetical protein SAMN03159423_4205 [Bradyrhizobium sp. NFR13]|jgi:hypothetical protein|uniref:hypothetical protein n=1 Tax=Bradyrhizobium sp. NFR13 TaxID=1566285 RepID=UPI0008E60709|nr:hypothetical protein [Bradyrhizobium sp. NFR13]SFL88752.1 hypothetical protein SAMN03159423_4205 [Bradyrhizobium sp. NFR13]